MTLVKCAKLEKHFALKAVAKAHIIETGQEEFLLNEKKVSFFLRLRAFRILGGSLITIFRAPSVAARETGHAGP